MPSHNHNYKAIGEAGTQAAPDGLALANSNSRPYSPGPKLTTSDKMDGNAIYPAGNNFPHNNMMPYLSVNFIIALFGVFPARD